MEDGFDFDEDFGAWCQNRDVQLAEVEAEDRRAVAEMADSPHAATHLRTVADELTGDELAALKQSIREQLVLIGISCGIDASRIQSDSDTCGGYKLTSYAVTLRLTSQVQVNASGQSPSECEADAMDKLNAVLRPARHLFAKIAAASDGPRAA